MKLKSMLSTLILLTILAATFVTTPVLSQEQRGPKIDKLRFTVIKGGLGPVTPPDEVLYLDEFNEWRYEWKNPPENALGPPDGLYIEGDMNGQWASLYSFEDITLGDREITHITLEGYTQYPNGYTEDVDIDIYGFSSVQSFAWLGSLWGTPTWDWHGVRWTTNDVLELMPELANETELNNMQILIYNYYGDDPDIMRVDAVRLNVWFEEWVDPRVKAMQDCTIDVLTDLIEPRYIEKLDNECNTITSTPGFHMCHIGFNIRPDQSYRRVDVTYWPLADVDFRHALVHAYDQQEIIATIYEYIVTPIRSLVPPAQAEWFNPGVPQHPYNPGDPFTSPPGGHSTCGILKAAGYTFADADGSGTVTDADYWNMPNGDPLPRMVIWTPLLEEAPTTYQHGQEFVNDLSTIGLKATSANGEHGMVAEGADFYYYREQVFGFADFDAYFVCWALGRFPTHLYDLTHSSQDSMLYPWRYNAPGINDPELDALTETVEFSLDHDAKVSAAHEIQEKLYDETFSYAFAYMNLYSRNYFNAFKTGLGGIINSPGYGSDNMWTFLNMHWQPHPNERIEDGKSTVIWCLDEEPDSLNPLYASTTYEWKILDRVYDPLIVISPYNHKDKPWLATDWDVMETSAGMEITFSLRNDVYWQDGYQYTAGDARFNWLFLRDWQIPRYTSTWEHIVDVEVIDTYTVKVYLDVTSQWLLYDLVGTAALLPQQIWDRPWANLQAILDYDPTVAYGTDMAPGYDPGPWAAQVPTNLFGTGPFIFQFYDAVCMYSDLLANRNYFLTTAEIDDLKTEMFWEVGDVNRDGVVDEVDLARMEAAMWSMPGDPNWDPDCDLNSDNWITTRDMSTLTFHFYWTREVRKAICYISVIVDIKPGSWPNPIHLMDKGVLSVAICGTEEFDVTTVNPETIRLTREGLETEIGVAPIRWSYEDLKKRDGYLDLTLQFETQEVITKLELDQFVDQTIPLIITGYLKEEYGSTPIRGQDCVWILG